MLKRRYKNTDLMVSALGFGCMRLPTQRLSSQEIDYERAQKLIDTAYAHGVNYYDTAYNYHDGLSEAFTGHALRRYPRESYFAASKFPVWLVQKKEDVSRIFEEQLARTGFTHFDFYLLHSQDAEKFQKCKEFGVIAFLEEMKRQGKIRFLGFSFHDTPPVLRDICAFREWDFAQIQLNYLDWEYQRAREQYEILTGRGIPVIVMEPVRGGALANPGEEAAAIFHAARPESTPASWAIRYAESLPNVLTVLSGMSNLEQVLDNTATLEHFEPLSPAEYEVVACALEAYRKRVAVPCTNCRYCMDCPFGVDIPGVFRAFNDGAFSGDPALFLRAYQELNESARAEQCRACGKCVRLCPQGIDIPDQMKKIALQAAQENGPA